MPNRSRAWGRQSPSRRFQLILIKPSHYDDDGYVIRWWRGMIPSNSLAAVYGIAQDARSGGSSARTSRSTSSRSTRPAPASTFPALIARFRRDGGFGLVGLVGVQSNQYPAGPRHRAAVPRRRHPGRDRRLPRLRLPVDARRARRRTSTPAAIWASRSSPARRRTASRPSCATWPTTGCKPDIQLHERPAGHRRHAGALPAASSTSRRTLGRSTSFDAGRGCPYQCSFCTIINVQGRKSRYRSPDDVENLVRAELAAGHQQVLHHRRQFRPQQGLGGDPRPPDRARARGAASRSAS